MLPTVSGQPLKIAVGSSSTSANSSTMDPNWRLPSAYVPPAVAVGPVE
jgi:hypothetical protein